jgi:hypothetical protein
MAFDASNIPADRIAKIRQRYGKMVNGRPTGAGVKADGTWTDPFDVVVDASGKKSYSLNPWLHADNMNPERGNVTLKNFKGKRETVPDWQADRVFSANLGLLGFNEITAQLKGLTNEFSANLRGVTDQGYANLAQQTGKKYISSKAAGQKRRWT